MAREDFYWEATDEPHATRRKQILAKYPQVQQLFGHDPNTKYIVTLVAISQLAIAYNMQYASWPFLIVFAWTIGGAINHYLNLAIHEITHNLAFATPLYNRLYAIFVPNLPLVLPAVVTFQKYHMDHHLYQGIEGVDMDIPTRFEGNTFTTSLKKLVWVFCQPYFYILRPLVAKPKPFGMWEIFNWIVQLTFDVSLVYFFGPKPLIYLLASLFLGMGIHPCAGHFIAEHYVFTPGFETYSYYGPLNMITLNVGYHNEHHDFPRIPGSRLPQLRKIAPEFYEPLPKYTSWIKVIWNYIVDPSISPYSRVMRKNKKMQKAQ